MPIRDRVISIAPFTEAIRYAGQHTQEQASAEFDHTLPQGPHEVPIDTVDEARYEWQIRLL